MGTSIILSASTEEEAARFVPSCANLSFQPRPYPLLHLLSQLQRGRSLPLDWPWKRHQNLLNHSNISGRPPLIKIRPALSLAALFLLFTPGAATADDWPSFRGAFARGVADGTALPTSWDVESGRNIRFSVPIPGEGYSSPIVVGEKIFLTSALPTGEGTANDAFEWAVLALDRKSGTSLWQTTVASGKPRTGRHPTASQTNPTPVSDGRTVVAILGSEGLFALDTSTGLVRWTVDLGILDLGLLGDAESQWGFASSPIIHDGRVFVQVDLHAGSYLVAYSLTDGSEVWRVDREERPGWSTPTIHLGDREELITQGGQFIRSYRPSDGKELWRFRDTSEVKQPTPIVSNGAVILAGGYKGRPLYSLRLGADGDVSTTEPKSGPGGLKWTSEEGGPYTSTPIAYGGNVFFVRNTGILTVLDEESGEVLHRRRLGDAFSASPVAGEGNLYFAGEDGSVHVIRAASDAPPVAEIDMGEQLMATPAIVDGVIYIRGQKTLWAVGVSPG